MASTTTRTRKPSTRTRKPKVETPVETPVEAPEAEAPSTEIAIVEKVAPPVDAQALASLNALTDEAQEALAAEQAGFALAGEAFHKAARAIRDIRDGKLVEKAGIVDEDGVTPLTFAQYVVRNFNRTSDLGDKYARAGNVLDRLQKELGDDIAKFPLPLTEGATRPMGKLLAQSKGNSKKLSTAYKQAFNLAETAAKKDGFVPTVVIPSASQVKAAVTDQVRSSGVNGSTKAPKTPSGNTDGVAAKLRKIHADNFAHVEWATFISIVAETAEVAHVAAKGVLRTIEQA